MSDDGRSPLARRVDNELVISDISDNDEPAAKKPADDDKPADSDSDSDLSDIDEDVLLSYQQEVEEAEHEIDEDRLKSIKIQKRVRPLDEVPRKDRPRERTRKERDGGKRKRPADDDDDDGAAMRPEKPEKILSADQMKKQELDRKMDAALRAGVNRPKKKKKDEIEIEKAQDDMIEHLKNRMTLAAKNDAEDKEKKLPAMHKLKMLPEVMEVFNKKHLIDPILDNNLLEAVRFWLEPLPDKSLPAYNIQRDLFAVITRLPIKTDNLRASGLGKIVLFYTKDIRPEDHIKRTAEKLIREWSRPILGKSDNYRHRRVQAQAYVPSSTQPKILSAANKERADPLAMPNLKPNRTRIPTAVPKTYTIAPVNNLTNVDPKTSRPLGASADDSIRRMRQRLMTGKSSKGRS